MMIKCKKFQSSIGQQKIIHAGFAVQLKVKLTKCLFELKLADVFNDTGYIITTINWCTGGPRYLRTCYSWNRLQGKTANSKGKS